MPQEDLTVDDGNDAEPTDAELQIHDDHEFRAGVITIDNTPDDIPPSSTFRLYAGNDGTVFIKTTEGSAIVGKVDVTQLENEAREQVEDCINPDVREEHRDNPNFPYPDSSEL